MPTDMRSTPNLYNIPAGAPFLQLLALGLMGGKIFPEFALADMRILLPTRRAARELTSIFLELAKSEGRDALLLPRIDTLGDIGDIGEADELNLTDELGSELDATLTAPINPHQRHFYLMQLIKKWSEAQVAGGATALTPAARAALAETLAQLLDSAHHEQVDWGKLESLVPDALAANWQASLGFLEIITKHWQGILSERGCQDVAAYHNAATQKLAAAWRSTPPATPIIAAGSTGSNKAVGELLSVIAHLPNGALVLAGLDTNIDSAAFAAMRRDPTHPQAGLANLLHEIGGDKTDMRGYVQDWMPEKINTKQTARINMLNAALVPAARTADWQKQRGEDKDERQAFEGFSLLTAPDQAQEAGCIALAMRQILAQSDSKTVALITRDRSLARRVAANLARWGVAVDDSAGVKLAQAPPALLLRLVLEARAANFSPITLLALLKHPLVAKNSREKHLRAVRALEKYALRGAYTRVKFLDELFARINKKLEANCPNKKEIEAINILLDNLKTAFAPMLKPEFGENNRATLREHLTAQCATAALLCAMGEAEDMEDKKIAGEEILFEDANGQALSVFLESLYNHSPNKEAEAFTAAEWQSLFEYWLSRQVVRTQINKHSRLFIWGPLEARLLTADLVIVGGLNEGSFPPIAEAGAWLSRGMRVRLGFSEPERAIGRAAHDFVAAAAAPQVLLTRAAKIDGTPAVEARWLRRLRALYGEQDSGIGETLLNWWQQLDNEDNSDATSAPILPPAPTPPLAARPKRLSVTQIETLIASPYNIYARKILNLSEWEALHAPIGAAERGSFLHKVLEILISKTHPAERADAPALKQKFLEVARTLAAQMDASGGGGAEILLFWQSRLTAIAEWVADFEAARVGLLAKSRSEQKGEWELPIAGENFTLSAKADRIDIFNAENNGSQNGGVAILDYKTGAPPSAKNIKEYYSVQMSLQAAMLAAGAFPNIDAAQICQLAYIRLNGKTPAGSITELEDVAGLASGAVEMLSALIAAYQNPAQAYLAAVHNTPYPSAYDHLARRAEWMSHEFGQTEEGGKTDE